MSVELLTLVLVGLAIALSLYLGRRFRLMYELLEPERHQAKALSDENQED